MWDKGNFTKKQIQQEHEANLFACALLMPEQAFREQWEKHKDLEEDKRLKMMAAVFVVPLFAVVIRIQMLSVKALAAKTE